MGACHAKLRIIFSTDTEITLKKNQFNALASNLAWNRCSGTLILLLIISALPQLTDDHFSLLICFPFQGVSSSLCTSSPTDRCCLKNEVDHVVVTV